MGRQRTRRRMILSSLADRDVCRDMIAHRTTQPFYRIATAICVGLLLLVATGGLHDACGEHPEESGDSDHEMIVVCQCACHHQHVVAVASTPRIQPDEGRDEPLLEYENPTPSDVSLGIFRPPRFLA